MKKTIGILAHVDGGKTTFSEQLLYKTKSIRSKGRVDHKNSFLDNHEIERDRGITIFSDIGIFSYEDSTYYLIDTPGHIDFSPEMERAIKILDYAILIISGVEGVQGHTETIWKILRKHNIKTFIFINKMDRISADLEKVLEECRNNLSEDIYYLNGNLEEDMNLDLIEFIAERDEELLTTYLDKGYDKKLWNVKLEEMILNNNIFLAFKGAALLDEGIDEFLRYFNKLSRTNYNDEGDFKGKVFKIKYDDKGNRITFIKAVNGTLKVKDEITYKVNGIEIKEKVNEIRFYNGIKFERKDRAFAGDVFGVLGLSNLRAGIGINLEEVKYDINPTLRAKVIYDKSINSKEILSYFKILESEDESLNVYWDETLEELSINIMGKIQLEILQNIVESRFNLNIEFGKPEIIYKETIEGETIGYGHFEPLKHYSEVHLKIEEGERNSGIIFINKCPNEDLTKGHQNLIKSHIFEREHRGILTGSSITDLKITLLRGRAHNKHTSGGDFRESTKRALRQGLECGKNKLLEPYYKFTIDVNLELIGRVISDIQKMNGEFFEPNTYGDRVKITGRGPVATFMDYPLEFVTFTKGKGMINLIFDGYDLCHNADEVIEKIGYIKDNDKDYTSSSIFCSKGEAFIVEGNKAIEYMHCLK